MVDEPVDCRQRHRRVREDPVPGRERLVGGDGEALSLVALGDQLEERARLSLIAAHVADVVQDEQIEPIELGEFGGKAQLAPRALQPLHQIAGTGEQHPPAPIDERMADRAHQVRLARAGRTRDILPGISVLKKSAFITATTRASG